MLQKMAAGEKKCQRCGADIIMTGRNVKSVMQLFRNVKDPFCQGLMKAISPANYQNLIYKMGSDEDTQAALRAAIRDGDEICAGEYFFQLNTTLFETVADNTEWESLHPFNIFQRCTNHSDLEKKIIDYHIQRGANGGAVGRFSEESHESLHHSFNEIAEVHKSEHNFVDRIPGVMRQLHERNLVRSNPNI